MEQACGYAFLINPLTPGLHTLTSHIEDGFFGAANDESYTINVLSEEKHDGKCDRSMAQWLSLIADRTPRTISHFGDATLQVLVNI
jgi:hypothetical protein